MVPRQDICRIRYRVGDAVDSMRSEMYLCSCRSLELPACSAAGSHEMCQTQTLSGRCDMLLVIWAFVFLPAMAWAEGLRLAEAQRGPAADAGSTTSTGKG
jgi:phenylacetate-coenzyme A ligase PaaK-like adenylate-forming protein